MKCVICKHGTTHLALTTVTLERGPTTIIIRDVPTLRCDNCGEPYHDARVSSALLDQAEAAVRSGGDLNIRRYATAA